MRELTVKEKGQALKKWGNILTNWEKVQVCNISYIAKTAQPDDSVYGSCPFCFIYNNPYNTEECGTCPLYKNEACSNETSDNTLYWQICKLLYRQYMSEKVPELKELIRRMITAIETVEVEG